MTNKNRKKNIITFDDVNKINEHVVAKLVTNNTSKPESFSTDLRVSGRTKQLNLPVTPVFHRQLKTASAQEGRPMAAILEDALQLYLGKK